MQSTSALYKSLFAMPNHYKEWRISVAGTVYGQDTIVKSIDSSDCEPKIMRPTFLDTPTVGGCYAAQFTCTLLLPSSQTPRMATIIPSYRLRAGNQASEWIEEGTFYVDVRTFDKASQTTSLTCYDDMLKADGPEGKPYSELTQFDEWPQPMGSVVDEICDLIGISLDPRTTISSGSGYTVGYPNDYTMREVLGYIAAAHGGNFVISPQRYLRLIQLTGSSDSVSSLGEAELALSEAFPAWSQVVVYYADEDAFEAGTDTGRLLEAEDPWAEQATANGLLAVVSGLVYQPFSVPVAILDPALEIGDTLSLHIDNSTVISARLWSIEIDCDSTSVVSVGAPGESAVDHEYPYASTTTRQMRRMVKLGQPYYGVTISKANGIEIKRSDGLSEALFNSDTFAMRALIDGMMKDRIYFDPIKGDYVFDGALGADAIFTDSLYADQGDIADLTVDRLSTSQRVRKYILGDITDDNHVRIQDQHIEFVTGTLFPEVNLLSEDGAFLLTEDGKEMLMDGRIVTPPVQVRNRYGQALYWQREPIGHTPEGYPTDADDEQIYATTDVTSWPVYTYEYTELVKSKFSFEEYVTSQGDDTYAPIIVLGAGDRNGNSKGFIQKEQNGMTISYLTNIGAHTDIRMGDYVDAKHRRLASCLIDTSTNAITYTVEGRDEEFGLTYTIQGDTITYTWPDGHTCDIVFSDGEEEEANLEP